MRTVLALAALVALASASAIYKVDTYQDVKTVEVNDITVQKQYKVLELFEAIGQLNTEASYYKIGKEYNVLANIDNFQNKEVVKKFYKMYEEGILPKYHLFSIFDEKMRYEAVALYDVFYYAKDFETLYNFAAWARVHLNQGMFAYTFYVALIQNLHMHDLALPAFYEIWPEFYANNEVFEKMYYTKMRGLPFEDYPEYGMVHEGDYYTYYSNYSDYYSYGDNEEYKLAYLTEDIGWNTFYTYFHATLPFWKQGDHMFNGLLKDRRGEIYYTFYQQLLARYYLERLSNGLGEIPRFSWYQPFKYGYRPYMKSFSYPFAQRPDNYVLQNEKNLDDLRFVRNYEDLFLSYLEQGQFKAYNQEVDLHNSKSINWVGNFWQTNPDLYEKMGPRHYYWSYEQAARRILSGAPYSYKDYSFAPSALDYYQTSLRDPAFYQIYNKITGFMFQYKKYLQPYTQDSLHYVGVKVNSVEVSKLTTYFDFHSFNASNAIVWGQNEFSVPQKSYMIMQPRLEHEPFDLKLTVKSDVEETATFKIFIGPKYDGKGYPISFEDNWMNFVQLDWFTHKLTKGENKIQRSSSEFFNFKDDSLPIKQIYKLLEEKVLPVDMVDHYDNLPRRLMLPRGTTGGFPLQFFVFVYPKIDLPKDLQKLETFILDDRPLAYPFDRPVTKFFWQPNMYIKEAFVYHKGPEYPWAFNEVYKSSKIFHH